LMAVVLVVGMLGCGGGNVGGSESYTLSINSTAGGSVTEPGEGTFVYDQGTLVNLKAEAQEGYGFTNWSGGVDNITNINAAATDITMEEDYSITANFRSVEANHVGVKVGDWIKLEYWFSSWPADQTYPVWLKLEFISIEGTIVTVRYTQHLSDGTEQSDAAPVDIAYNSEVPLLAGMVIRADRTRGNYVYMAGYGNVSIQDEAIETYAGASRTIVYASFWPGEAKVTYRWDKLTGVVVELSSTSPDYTATAKATETNMWEATTMGMPWWPWIIVAVVAVGLVIFFVRRRRAG
jgi:hypothetical protein